MFLSLQQSARRFNHSIEPFLSLSKQIKEAKVPPKSHHENSVPETEKGMNFINELRNKH